KAELAQQQHDYQSVASLGKEAMQLGLHPEDPTELLIFIEGFALTDDVETAIKLSEMVLDEDARIRRGVCTVWKQIQGSSQVGNEQEIEVILLSLSCNS